MDKPKLDQVIHHPHRLTIMTALMNQKTSRFPELKAVTGLTDGNLGSHLQKLEEQGYIRMEKNENKRGQSIAITKSGEQALLEYVRHLKSLLDTLPV